MEERQEVIANNVWKYFNEELAYDSDLNINSQINEDARKAIYGNFTRKCIKEWPFAIGADERLIDLAISKTYEWAARQEDYFEDSIEETAQEFAVASMNRLAHLILFS